MIRWNPIWDKRLLTGAFVLAGSLTAGVQVLSWAQEAAAPAKALPAQTEAQKAEAAKTAATPAAPTPPPNNPVVIPKFTASAEALKGSSIATVPVAAVSQDAAPVVPQADLSARAPASVEVKTAEVKPVAARGLTIKTAKRIVKSASARRGRVASNVKSAKRGPASVSGEDVAVFDEKTSFETLVAKRAEMNGRNPASFAPQARIIAVRRELGLTTSDANAAPQDIVLNAGTESGLDEGMVLSVARSIPILDPYRENQQKQLEVEFAKIKIVHAQNNLAIARLEKIDSIRKGVAVGTRAVLIGDYVGQFSK